ncbi:MAG TPA: cation-transporting P-type ATPase, partial [Polyangiaceae bacterium]|nr:cation-transporting P-type ATPase [Polyangiaceae bacterium]
MRSALPGRYRLWVAGLYQNEELKSTLEGALNGTARRRARANVVAGTLLVQVQQGVELENADSIAREIEEIVEDFAAARSLTASALERRGVARPLYFALTRRANGKAHGADGTDRAERRERRRRRDRESRSRRSLVELGKGWLEVGKGWLARALPKGETAEHLGEVIDTPGEEQPGHDWHLLPVESARMLLGVGSLGGLSSDEALARLVRYQPNTLPAVRQRSALAMLLGQFKELPVLLLAGSTVLSMLTGGIADGAVILGVIVLNGVIGFFTESSAERSIASLTRKNPTPALVARDGRELQLAIEGVVPGDVILLRPGSAVPADARVLEAYDLSIDESSLTGESMPVSKTSGLLTEADVPLADRRNMVYRGTMVTGGSGRALVVATGRTTQVGQLTALVSELERRETPMQKQLRELGERTVVLAGVVCGGMFLIGLLRGHPFGALIRTAVSLAVAAVPEGLPTVAITTLAIGIRRMKEQHVLVRRIDAIETLGAVQVLCFDKTGTITHNRMRLVQATVGRHWLAVERGRFHEGERELTPAELPGLEWLLRVGALCSEAAVVNDSDEAPESSGSATECALVDAALSARLDVNGLRLTHPVERIEHRTEERKWMSTLHHRGPFEGTAAGHVLAVKGSPLEVLELCSLWLDDGQVVPLTEEARKAIARQNQRMASDALRVLGMAYAEQEGTGGDPGALDQRLIWLGLVGLADPPREGLPELIAKFRRAGVRSVMITGDQSATAYAIAQQIGLGEDGELRTLDSVELDRMDPEVLADLAPHVHVFSRVSPRHKLRIVQALQKSGLVVAMTGDGINDCPALKAADIGVAMGAGGAATREVADMVLERDDLAAMLLAIEHGRVIHADIKKAVRFILATNLSEILLTFLSVAVGFGEAMSPMQLLWINLVSDVFPELALALHPGEKDILERPPRDPEAKMFSRPELQRIGLEGGLLTLGALGVYGYAISRYGMSPQARGLAFVALSSAQLLHAFSTRSERNTLFDREPAEPNPYLPASVLGGIGLTVLMQFIPATRRWLGSGA